MKFPYAKLPRLGSTHLSKVVYRPQMPISISYNKGNTINLMCLIDSGADFSLFGKEWAQLLGIDPIRNTKYVPMKGISGVQQNGYIHTVTISFGGHTQQLDAVFLSDDKLEIPILGQEDFFSKNKVVFDYTKKEFEITPKP